jgi:hypothetical protein
MVHTKGISPSATIVEKPAIDLGDIKRTKSTHTNHRALNNSRRIAKRSTLMETPSPTTAYITSQLDSSEHYSARDDSHRSSLLMDQQQQMRPEKEEDATLINTPIPSSLGVPSSSSTLQRRSQDYVKTIPKAKFYYFAELGALDHYMLKHIAVLYLDELLEDHFSLEELADLIDDKKNSTLWGKFVTSLKTGGNKKTHTKGK